MHGAADQSHSSHRSEPAGRTASVDKSVRSRLAKSLTLGGISLGYAVVQLDVTTVNTALSSVGKSLGGGVSELQWVVTAYTIAFAALILTAGALGDRFGAKRIFMAGFASHACLPQSRRSRVTASGRLRNYDRTCVGQRLIINLGPPHAIRSSGTSVNAFAAISKERRRAA